MIFYVNLFLGLTVAQNICFQANLPLDLPTCTDTCLVGPYKFLDGTCADNLKGFCDLSDGVRMFFSQYSDCLLSECPDDEDRSRFIHVFKDQCESTVREWKDEDVPPEFSALLTEKPASSMKTITIAKTSKAEAPSAVQTLIGPPLDQSTSEVERPTTPNTSAGESKTSTSTLSTEEHGESSEGGKPTPNSIPTSIATIDYISYEPEDRPESTVHIHETVTTASSSIPAPVPHNTSKEGLGVKAIVAIAVGGTVFLALVIGILFFVMRHRKKSKQAKPTTPEDPGPSRSINDKPELDRGAIIHPYPEIDTSYLFGTFEKAELQSDQTRLMVDRYPHLGARNLTKSPLNSSVGRNYARYYSPRNEKELYGSSMIDRADTVVSPTTAPTCRSPFQTVSETSTMQTGHPFSPVAPTDTPRDAELHGDPINHRYGEGRPNATVSVVELDVAPR